MQDRHVKQPNPKSPSSVVTPMLESLAWLLVNVDVGAVRVVELPQLHVEIPTKSLQMHADGTALQKP